MGVVFILSFTFEFYFIFILLIVLRIYNFNFYRIFGEKISFSAFQFSETYECGFDTFHNKVFTYTIQFFNIGISYIIFDLEICILFLFFYLLNFYLLNLNFIFLFLFILVLIKVFIEEVLVGTLNF